MFRARVEYSETLNYLLYKTQVLQSLFSERDVSVFILVTRLGALRNLQDASLESARSFYPILSQLQCLVEVDNLAGTVLG